MAKKKVKKVKKAKKVVKVKKAVKAKRKLKTKKVVRKIKVQAKSKEKVLGKIDHYFDNISVAAIKVKAPFQVGDVIHVKGHTTDFFQKIDSMQIEHQNVQKVKKGDDVGMKVKEFVRKNDTVYRADEKALTAQATKPAEFSRPVTAPKQAFQTTIFKEEKQVIKPPVGPAALPGKSPSLSPNQKPASPKPEKRPDQYSDTKFFNF